MMFCTNCGQRLTDDAKHCPNCGALIVRDGTNSEDPNEAAKPYQEQPAYRDPYNYAAPQAKAPKKEDGYALTALILAIISGVCCCLPIIGLPCAVIGIIFAIKGMRSETRHAMAMIALILGIVFAVCNAVGFISIILMAENADSWSAIFDEIYEHMDEFRYYH